MKGKWERKWEYECFIKLFDKKYLIIYYKPWPQFLCKNNCTSSDWIIPYEAIITVLCHADDAARVYSTQCILLLYFTFPRPCYVDLGQNTSTLWLMLHNPVLPTAWLSSHGAIAESMPCITSPRQEEGVEPHLQIQVNDKFESPPLVINPWESSPGSEVNM